MDDELKSKAIEIITQLQGLIVEGAAQLPAIATSYILYGRVLSTLGFIVFLIITVLCVGKIYKISRLAKENDNWEDYQVVETIISCFLGSVAFILTVGFTQNVVLVWAAPEVWLLKELVAIAAK